MFGLSKEDWLIVEEALIRPLKNEHCELYIFGSRARGDFNRFSDLDVLVVSEDNLQEKLGEIRDALEDSELPIKVDVVLDSELAESYRRGVEEDKVSIELS